MPELCSLSFKKYFSLCLFSCYSCSDFGFISFNQACDMWWMTAEGTSSYATKYLHMIQNTRVAMLYCILACSSWLGRTWMISQSFNCLCGLASSKLTEKNCDYNGWTYFDGFLTGALLALPNLYYTWESCQGKDLS